MTDHAELRRVAKAATPGPWSCNRHWAIVGGPTLEFTNGAAQQQIAMACWQSWMHEEELRNNAEFIAANNPKTVLALLDEIDRLKAEIDQCASTLPATYYMDPPDGGNVSIPEQIRRMAKDAARYRWLRERDLETISRGGVFAGMTPKNIVLNLEDLDAEIDAAIEGAKQ
ncbi:TPA: ead/Ea22-like family protein [Pseudomonas aeruginosa]|nr:ead/Ea22-like family protein [Pseudomonas aeruginosa]HEJ6312616.1 ead/Ea22-like family protein [Pseudomonas aeruginosa]